MTIQSLPRWLPIIAGCLSITTISWAGQEIPKPIEIPVEQFTVQGNNPLDKATTQKLLTSFSHQSYSLDGLNNVAKALEQAIRAEGYAFYRVVLPPQILNAGTVKLKIVEFTLAKIEVRGNHHFDETNLKASVPGLTPGSSPNTDSLAQALKVANRHPSKQIQVTFKQSPNQDKVDAQLDVIEQRPYDISLLLNNTGTPGTGEFRMTGSVQYSNLWNRDHIITGSYTTSPDHANTVQQYGVSYNAPVYPLRSWISAYYSYSSVDNGVVANDFNISGSGEMYGLHYLQYLPRLGRYEHWLDIGLDNRFFINDIEFQNENIGPDIRSVPFSILYKGDWLWSFGQTGFNVQWVGNTDFGGHNAQNYYADARLGARQNWDLIRYGGYIQFDYQQWLLRTTLTGQYSHHPLISGEQIGLGGTYSVRGYNERETSADVGEQVKIELISPSWQGLSSLIFYDYGHGQQQSALPEERKNWTLSSIGIGARYQWHRYAQAYVDLAHTLDDGLTTDADTRRVHAGIILRY